MEADIVITQMKKDDDTNNVARLIYETSVDLFKALFGKKQKAIPIIQNLIKLDNNIFSYKRIRLAKQDNKIVGILIGYDVNAINTKDMTNDFKSAMSILASIRCWIIFSFSHHIMDFKDIEGFYVQNLCVDSKSRGKRIGYKLLEHCISDNSKKGIQAMYLDVENHNDIAINLYKKIGFKMIRETNIRLAGISLFRMKREMTK